jgi:ATP-dependent Clp protease ATP-binding subunit ClpA
MARSGLGNPQKPIGNFLFSGPRASPNQVAQRSYASAGLIQFDASEYAGRHAVSRMIGAPPGYIGLTKAASSPRRSPHRTAC